MLYVEIIVLLLLLLLEYVTSKRDIMHISFMSLASFIFALLLVAVNISWEYEMSGKTAFIITMTFLSIFLGEHFQRYFVKKTRTKYVPMPFEGVKVNSKIYMASVVLMIGAVIIYVGGVLTVGRAVLTEGLGNGSVFSAYRYSAVQQGTSGSSIMSIAIVILECFSNTYMLLYITNRKEKKYLLPIILYLIAAVFSTGRMAIIKFAIVTLVLYYLLISRPKGQTRKFETTMIKVLVIGIGVFIGLGMLTGKSGLYSSVFENVSMYIASGIPAFDKSIEVARTGFTGTSIWGIVNFLSKFGIEFSVKNNYLPYVYFPYMNHSTNIYTFLKRPYEDFGILLMLILFFVIAVIYTKAYSKIVNQSCKRYTFTVLMYSSMYYPIFMTFSDFRFSDILSLTGIIQIVIYYVIAKKIDCQLKYVDKERKNYAK